MYSILVTNYLGSADVDCKQRWVLSPHPLIVISPVNLKPLIVVFSAWERSPLIGLLWPGDWAMDDIEFVPAKSSCLFCFPPIIFQWIFKFHALQEPVYGIQELVSTPVKMGWDRALCWEDIKCYQTQAAWRQSNLACLKEWGRKTKTVCGTNGSLDLTSSIQCTHSEMSHEANKHKWHLILHEKLVYQKCHASHNHCSWKRTGSY